jgi:hypothetical protein
VQARVLFSIVASQSACGEQRFHKHIQGGQGLPFFFFMCQTFNGSLQSLPDMAAHLYAIANGRDKFESTLPVDVVPLEILERLERMSDHAHCAPFAPSLAIDDK